MGMAMPRRCTRNGDKRAAQVAAVDNSPVVPECSSDLSTELLLG